MYPYFQKHWETKKCPPGEPKTRISFKASRPRLFGFQKSIGHTHCITWFITVVARDITKCENSVYVEKLPQLFSRLPSKNSKIILDLYSTVQRIIKISCKLATLIFNAFFKGYERSRGLQMMGLKVFKRYHVFDFSNNHENRGIFNPLRTCITYNVHMS